MESLVFSLLIGGVALIGWGALAFMRAIFKPRVTPSSLPRLTSQGDDLDGMNEGDYHNGPDGYSPMSGYPETQYGGHFDNDSEGDERHE